MVAGGVAVAAAAQLLSLQIFLYKFVVILIATTIVVVVVVVEERAVVVVIVIVELVSWRWGVEDGCGCAG